MWHDSFIRDMTRPLCTLHAYTYLYMILIYMQHDSRTCAMTQSYLIDITHSYETWPDVSAPCAHIHSYTSVLDTLTYVIWLMHMWHDLILSCWHDPFIRDMTRPLCTLHSYRRLYLMLVYTQSDSCKCAMTHPISLTRPIHTRHDSSSLHVTRIYVCMWDSNTRTWLMDVGYDSTSGVSRVTNGWVMSQMRVVDNMTWLIHL